MANETGTLVVNFAAGGSNDVSPGDVSKLSRCLGQQVVVDNRVGAGGKIESSSSRRLRRTYTLLMSAGTILSIHTSPKEKWTSRRNRSDRADGNRMFFGFGRAACESCELRRLRARESGQANYGSAGNGPLQTSQPRADRAANIKVTPVA